MSSGFRCQLSLTLAVMARSSREFTWAMLQCKIADLLQIVAEMQRVSEQAQHAANLREAVGSKRRQMGSIDAATVAENQARVLYSSHVFC